MTSKGNGGGHVGRRQGERFRLVHSGLKYPVASQVAFAVDALCLDLGWGQDAEDDGHYGEDGMEWSHLQGRDRLNGVGNVVARTPSISRR